MSEYDTNLNCPYRLRFSVLGSGKSGYARQVMNSPFHVGAEAALVPNNPDLLEAVLSADNAIALAALSQGWKTRAQRQALNGADGNRSP